MNINTAYFAGGCFWCMTKPFDTFDGIEKVTSGYMGGHIENPTYEQVKSGTSGHLETVEIQYDVALFSYNKLLEIFFSVIDPLDTGGQYQDRGPQYQTAIFYTNDHQKELAETYIGDLKIRLMLIRQLQQKYYPRHNFTKPKTITKIFIRKIQSAMQKNKKYAKNTKIINNIYT